MNKYIWAEFEDGEAMPVIKKIVANNYKEAIEKIAEQYEEYLDMELDYDNWEVLGDALDEQGIHISEKLLDIEEL
jgi:hypothetical protein